MSVIEYELDDHKQFVVKELDDHYSVMSTNLMTINRIRFIIN